MKCSRCNSLNIQKRGKRRNRQRQRCNDCGAWASYPIAGLTSAKVLLFDIETTPMEVYVWGLIGNKYINHDNIIRDWNMLSWSAKWLCDAKVLSMVQTPKEAREGDDERIVKGIHKLMDEADVVVAHNGNKFDIKKLNTRFRANALHPPSPYQSIDTLLVSKRHFSFTSNKLDYLSKIMTNRGKIETNFDLWKNCLAGDKKALDKMQKYNEEDVRLLEEVYVELRPWIKSHPNLAIQMQSDKPACPSCGSEAVLSNGNYYTTSANMYESYTCGDCGSMSRNMKGDIPLRERQTLLRTMPR